MKGLAAVLLMAGALLISSCGPTSLHPTVTVTQSGNSLAISGAGFSHYTPCAHLAIVGSPVGAISLGDANCSLGVFKNFNWSPNYVPGCVANTPQTIIVTAVDISTASPAAAKTSILWGKDCAIVGTCGKIGQRVCPNPTSACYLSGGPNPSTGMCVACGKEGQPLCTYATNGSQCDPGLNPNLKGGQPICTAYCGWTQGAQAPCADLGSPDCGGKPTPTLLEPESACQTQQTVNGRTINVYSCFGDGVANSIIDPSGSCTCVPNNVNSCQGDTSGTSGVCMHGTYTGC